LAADELERLEQDFALLEALEVRNEAQIESFVDAEDQWESLEPEEQELLKSKVDLKERIDELMKEVE
jgi:predicted  nucleic acid-binding Zn-ribbon protein